MAAKNNSTHSVSSEKSESTKKKKKAEEATVGETLSFVFGCGGTTTFLFFLGFIGGIGNGAVFPALAYVFSNSFSDISGASTEGLDQVRSLAHTFMVVGVYALVMATIQTSCFEYVAYNASQNLRLQWFRALIRQDPAFFDVHDIGGIASNVGPSVNRYRRGLGRKFGEGIQFLTTGIGGVGYALYSNWRVALVVMAVVPFASVSALMVVTLNQTKTKRAAESYSRAGGIAYSTVSGIKTVLSLNAVPRLLEQYAEATQEAKEIATAVLMKQGCANGSMLGSFLILYAVLALYGTYLLYNDVSDSGCDPSAGVSDNERCDNSGPDVFGAMLGVAFSAQGIGQVGNFLETFSTAKVAAFNALTAINRKIGAGEKYIYHTPDDDKSENMSSTTHSSSHGDLETPEGRVKAILPKYEIDSTSPAGLKPKDIEGRLTFENVKFRYPTRPAQQILNGFSIDVPAGKTIAFVGPSGGGKSTVVKLLERFYDPIEGSVSLDGINIKDLNVKYLRSMIGYVGQEPKLFATSIAENIKHGNPSATREQIEEAAKLANAHDFISSMTDGYETQVGDKGSQLSGGQKQRIAIARVLVGNPKLLLLDEATSALDSESELVVQEALDNVLAAKKRTTVIIAHRFSTIRNADIIAVVQGGVIVETGTHDELMTADTGYYRALVQKQKGMGATRSSLSSDVSSGDLEGLDEVEENVTKRIDEDIVLEFKDVTFSYPTRPKRLVLKDFNLQIRKGETVALVGTSGGGKSTTVAMIERFYDPASGSVEFKGVDIKSLNVAWYRDQIGYVGQEPTLFSETIASNIAYGYPNATRAEIEDAARQANAYDFIKAFPEGFDTHVGEGGGQLSGGQKQRVAIARALVKKPEILLLDEATSALDNESESIVQAALDKLMESKNTTCIVIAHRLTTIQNADRIAFISDGHVKEFGTHEELMRKPKGRYRRLVESQDRNATSASLGMNNTKDSKAGKKEEEEEEVQDWEKASEEEEKGHFSMSRVRSMASSDTFFLLVGAVGALLAGSVYPMWGVLFAETIELLFRRVLNCTDEVLEVLGYDSCEEYWDDTADDMREHSFLVALYWFLVAIACVTGFILTFWGFGQASERLNKRVRDASFKALCRQDVAYFDKRSVGKITSQLQDDAARLHTFTGDPIRAFLIALASVFTGVCLSFAYMWPFALLAIGCIPLMGFATSLHMKQMLGNDTGSDEGSEERNSPGGIVVETLLNITTVSALTLEEVRCKELEAALATAEPNHVSEGVMQGFMSGFSVFIQQWINALQIWFGGWLLYHHADKYAFNDFLIANFAILFSLFGLGAAFQDVADRKEMEISVSRIFYLLDRKSPIDPLSEDGRKL